MSDRYWIPQSGRTTYTVTRELTYGICPFTSMDMNWSTKRGTLFYGEKAVGHLANVTVARAPREAFTANFKVTRAHRSKTPVQLSGRLSAYHSDAEGNIAFKVTGLPDWRDNTTFEANRKIATIQKLAGKRFHVTLASGAGAKAAIGFTCGNLITKDLGSRMKSVYPLIGAGLSYGAGATLYSSSAFKSLELSKRTDNWSGSKFALESSGVNALLGLNSVGMKIWLPHHKDPVYIETDGYDFSVGLDISANISTLMSGKLGDRTIHERF